MSGPNIAETILNRPDGSQVRLLAQDYSLPGGKPAAGVDVFHRASEELPWRLCSDQAAPLSEFTTVEDYIQNGRPEKFRVASHGEIFKAAAKLREQLAQAPDPFTPWFQDLGEEGVIYDDGRVRGQVELFKHDGGLGVAILEWTSKHRNQGHTTEALRWMRTRNAVYIEARGVGTLDAEGASLVPDIPTLYWAHMMKKGLVDRMFDDDGQELVINAAGEITYADASIEQQKLAPRQR